MAKDDIAGEGYEILPVGAIIKYGDECLDINGEWHYALGVGYAITDSKTVFRRYKKTGMTIECRAHEVDPNGIEAHTAGAKLDHGKLRAGLVLRGFKDALVGVSKVGTFGAAKYSDNGWKSVENGYSRYEDALYRHLLADGVDEQSNLPHLYHAAWNILAMIQLSEDVPKEKSCG